MKRKIVLTGHDEMVKTGNPALLEVKVERKLISYWAPNLADIRVDYKIAQQVIGTALTDSNGIATLTHIPAADGLYTIEYELALKERNIQSRPGRLFSISGQRPAVVVDIDGTISDYPDWKVPFGGGTAPAFPHASEFLWKLSSSCELIYITARDDILDGVTLAFLQRHNFPPAPVFYNDWWHFRKKPDEFKYRTIVRIQKNGVPVVAGIGDSLADVRAYLSAGLDVYIRRENDIAQEGVILFRDYRELELMFCEKESHYRESVREKSSG